MSPADAAAIALEEPDWLAEFENSIGDDFSFEHLLLRWRQWHATPVEISGQPRKQLAPQADAVIAFATLGLFPPRDMPDHLAPRAPGRFEEQLDNHVWVISKESRAWRITGIEDKTMFMGSFGETKQLDLSKANWDGYVQLRVAELKALEKGPAAMP